ncbi:MAG: potassium-transporting ATPase subunit KdpC [Pseudomonadota bacterium]|nr:potassium-transporting ATPase subunit KdpC [Pseudomonadota bacterium]
MKTTLNHFRPTLVFLALFSLLFGGVYPALCTTIIQELFPAQAQGSLIEKDGKVIGSELIGQNFSDPKYFWGRLSATTPPYNAVSSSGSNLAPENPTLLNAVKARLEALKVTDPKNQAPVPVDLVTASGSGLDPHISPAAAEYQIPRVARARHMDEERMRALVLKYTEERQWGVLGEPRVNVLALNRALDGK